MAGSGSDRMNFEEEPAGSALPSTNWDGTKSRLITLPDGSVWLTINASWNGTAFVKDVVGQMSSAYMFSIDGFAFLTQTAGIASWLSYDWATQTSLGPNGQIRSPGQISAVFCSEFMSATASGYLGGAVSFGKAFPTTPSSISFTTTYINGVTGTPNVSVLTNTGLGWYAAYSGLGDIFVGGYVTVS